MNNINAKTIIVPKIQTRSYGYAVFAPIIALLQWINRNYDDYELRGTVGEWTRDEARAEILGDFENAERNRLAGVFWSGG